MSEPKNLGSFLAENKALIKEYVETRMEIYRLRILRTFSKSAGYFAWIIILLFLILAILFFGGMTLGFWFSDMMHSYVKGFALTTVLILVLFILLIIFRKPLFVNPVTQSIIQRSHEVSSGEEGPDEDTIH